MYKDVNLSYFISEIRHNIKYIIVGGVIIALFVAGITGMQVRDERGSVSYASCGKVFTNFGTSREYSDINVNDKDHTDSLAAIIKSDHILQEVINSETIRKYKLTESNLRDMIRVIGTEDGKVFDLYVICSEGDEAQMVNELLINAVVEYLQNNNYKADIVQEPSFVGCVKVEDVKPLTDNPNKTVTVITTSSIPSYANRVLEMGILGFVIGIIFMVAYVCIKFVTLDYVVYREQIENLTGIKVLGKRSEQDWLDVWGALVLQDKQFINIFYYKEDCIDESFVSECNHALDKLKQKCLFVGLENENELVDSNFKHTDFIDEKVIFDKNTIKEKIEEWENTFDTIVIKTNSFLTNFSCKLLSSYADINILVFKSKTIKSRELKNIERWFNENNYICTCVFLD